jgi:tetratricopeptide (TPR) repeat protein
MQANKIILILLSSIILYACAWNKKSDSKKEAEILSENNKYSEAINEYQKHIEDRLKVKGRPEWENPYIYYLDIGDLLLKQGLVDRAVKKYMEADEKGINPAWVNDRLRQVASWYEERGMLNDAIDHLKKYRHRDELLFDLMLNRLAKQLVENEIKSESSK